MNKLLFHLGNLLIIISLLGFAFIFYPILQTYITPPVVQKVTAKEGNFLTIPKIHAQSSIILNVDPWTESVYDEALTRGIAHAKGTSLPGEKGTSFLFAHSSGAPWEMTRNNTIFLRLGELNTGDEIIITKNGKELKYKVTNKKEVDPSEINYLLQTDKTQLILQTCTPIGTSLRRLLIFAEPA
jgi:sortase A